MKRPWNIVDMPVYSLATYEGDQVNMNICTYVSAVSMKPKLFMIGVDYSTKTYELISRSSTAVLQILHEDHKNLIKLLGKSSGRKIDKNQKLEEKELLTTWHGRKVLAGACGYLLLDLKERANIGGDHEIFYFSMQKSTTKEETGVLMFQKLISEGLIL
ncbi:MAG: flavin reductase [Bacteroidota bacterium]